MGEASDGRTGPPDAAGSGSGTPASGTALSGPLLREIIPDACSLLQRHTSALNAINVFPVPDGDTGTNAYLTLRAGVEELQRTGNGRVDQAAQALAHGALMGARGNSGVILSQILRGVATGLEGIREADGPAFAGALSTAADAAYRALSNPVEGTILTVVRSAAAAAEEGPPASFERTLARATAAAKEAVERTPKLLPVLKEAGVVDAGGLGLSIILEGSLRSLRKEPLDVDLAPEGAVAAAWRNEAASLHDAEHGTAGYCTEFVASGSRIDAAAAREELGSMGTSLLIVGGDDLLRVHVHTARPDDVLAYGRTLGKLSHVKVDNMEAQVQRFMSGDLPPEPVTGAIGIVAVATGEGIRAAFRSVGVTQLVQGGQTMNPSAGEILEAVEACAAEQVVVLPNNSNIVAAARQAVEQATKQAVVVPSRSVPEGIAAVLALNPDLSFDANTEAMERALKSVKSAEVTRAVRATTIDGRRVELGQVIGIAEGKVRAVGDGIEGVLRRCVDEMRTPEASLLTLYSGLDVREAEAEELASALRETHPDLEIELVRGGQPHYLYFVSLE